MTSVFVPGYCLGERFELVRFLGRGAVGDVWLARDTCLENEEVACKLLRDRYAQDCRAVAGLKREVLLTRRLRHPGIVALHSFWQTPQGSFITMEHVPGPNLDQVRQMRVRPFALSDVLPWMCQLCEALGHAHNQGILHRDVKPANILLAPDNSVRLTDFGIARAMRDSQLSSGEQTTSGTLLFMSPEQLRGEALDQRSDLYSLASTLYELLSGKAPFRGGMVTNQILSRTPSPVEGLPESVQEVLFKALSKEPEQRQLSCSGFWHELSSAAVSSPVNASHPIAVAAQEAPSRTAEEIETRELHVQTTGTRRLGEILIDAGAITRGQLREALAVQSVSGGLVGDILQRLGHITEAGVLEAVSRQLGIPKAQLDRCSPDAALLAAFPREFCEQRRCLPFGRSGGCVQVAMADPLDLNTVNAIEEEHGLRVDIYAASESAIRAVLARCPGPSNS